MLQVRDTAAVVLQQERANSQVPDSFGVRVFSKADEDGQETLAISFAEEPARGDKVTVQCGTEFYIAPDVAESLSDRALDVEHSPEGARLTLAPQDDGEQQ